VNEGRTAERVKHSDELHTRVQRWIHGNSATREPFEALALALAQFQADCIPGYARLLEATGAQLDSLDSIAPVPTDAFRLSRIAVHPSELDTTRYVTSGTTSANRGLHALRRVDTYRASAVACGRAALLREHSHAAVAALLPVNSVQTSSLAAMAQMFMDEFEPDAPGAKCSPAAPSPWLLDAPDVVAALVAHLDRAKALGAPLLLVATSLALVHLLELLDGKRLEVKHDVIIMPTGGSKGKAETMDPAELRARVMDAFRLDPNDASMQAHEITAPCAHVIGEYGMTELGSQLYELPPEPSQSTVIPGVYYAPAWLHVCPVDPETLKPVAPGSPGLARFIDLANVDSAVCVVTQDLIRARGDGFELLGRQTGAPARGCSLATEEWLQTLIHPAR
jgi:hypothetical protein